VLIESLNPLPIRSPDHALAPQDAVLRPLEFLAPLVCQLPAAGSLLARCFVAALLAIKRSISLSARSTFSASSITSAIVAPLPLDN
jgi:hypothetical protein